MPYTVIGPIWKRTMIRNDQATNLKSQCQGWDKNFACSLERNRRLGTVCDRSRGSQGPSVGFGPIMGWSILMVGPCRLLIAMGPATWAHGNVIGALIEGWAPPFLKAISQCGLGWAHGLVLQNENETWLVDGGGGGHGLWCSYRHTCFHPLLFSPVQYLSCYIWCPVIWSILVFRCPIHLFVLPGSVICSTHSMSSIIWSSH